MKNKKKKTRVCLLPCSSRINDMYATQIKIGTKAVWRRSVYALCSFSVFIAPMLDELFYRTHVVLLVVSILCLVVSNCVGVCWSCLPADT